jgi:hypothetical protein
MRLPPPHSWVPLVIAAIIAFVISTPTTRAAAAAADAPAKNPTLVITSAVYGDLDNDKTADVLKKVAAAVKDNNLNITVDKETLGDPAPGAAKKLKVGYTLDGLYYSKTINDGEVCDISTRLFIHKALYGDLTNNKADDVTDQLRALVSKNTLSVKADNETFGDPAPNVVKKLRVDYTFDGVKKSKSVAENGTLTISEKGN